MTATTTEYLLTPAEFARRVGRRRERIQRLITDGRLAATPYGRGWGIPRSELDRFPSLLRPTGGQPGPPKPKRLPTRRSPIKHTRQVELEVLNALAGGLTTRSACEVAGLDAVAWYRWLKQDHELAREAAVAAGIGRSILQ